MLGDRCEQRIFELIDACAISLQLLGKRIERLDGTFVAETFGAGVETIGRSDNEITNQIVRNEMRVNLFTHHRGTLAAKMFHLHVCLQASDIEFDRPVILPP